MSEIFGQKTVFFSKFPSEKLPRKTSRRGNFEKSIFWPKTAKISFYFERTVRCKKTCKKHDKPDEGHDFKRGVMMSDMQVMPIDRLAEKNSEIILIDDEAASK